MQVSLQVKNWSDCQAMFQGKSRRVIDKRSICAGPSDGKDSCYGDSGGPLVATDEESHYVQIGVVSWGLGCGRADFEGVYTRVSAFEPWLRAKTRIDQSQPSADTQNVVTNGTGAPNPAHLTVRFVQGRTLKAGQSVRAEITTQRPGYLVLLNASADGKITRILSKQALLRLTGEPVPLESGSILIPNPKDPYLGAFDYLLDLPAGPGQLVAVLTREPIKNLNIPDNPKTFESAPRRYRISTRSSAGSTASPRCPAMRR